MPESGMDASLSSALETIASDSGSNAPPQLQAGASVGRYVLLQQLGAGAMGVVYAAFDPQLDRKLAIKVLQSAAVSQPSRASMSQPAERLLREAKTLAKLSHPNVVAIHDVGMLGDGPEPLVFIAMEYVAGDTFGGWIARTQPSVAETVRVLLAAGQGVAAAHEAGLVHRDLKPDNVMIGDDGRVRVMDFGLARAARTSIVPADDVLDTMRERLDAEAAIIEATIAGGLVGTPAYMAPEQFRGETADARTDQFNFCVMAWEALYGKRPFSGDSVASLALSVCHGEIEAVPAGRPVPAWLRTTLARGLSNDPAARFASMRDLLRALARGETIVRRRRWAFAGLGLVAVAAAGWGWHRADVASRREGCAQQATALADAWQQRRGEVDDRLRETAVGHAAITADKVQRGLDRYVEQWREASEQVCLAGTVDETLPEPALERAEWCLESRQAEAEALVDALGKADAVGVHLAVEDVHNLARPQRCLDQRRLAYTSVPPAEQRERVREVQRKLAGVRARSGSERAALALALAEEALVEARTLAWPPLVAQALFRVGLTQRAVGDQVAAEGSLTDAYFAALEADAIELAELAAAELAHLVGYELSRHDAGKVWARLADAHGQRLEGNDGGLRTAQRHAIRGLLAYATGEYVKAIEQYRQAYDGYLALFGSNHPRVAEATLNVGSAEFSRGKVESAQEAFEKALRIQTEAFGPAHPKLARALNNLAAVARAKGDLPAARASLVRALKIRESAYGPAHTKVITLVMNIAILDAESGDLKGAREGFQRARDASAQVFGEDSVQVARADASIGATAFNEKDLEAARPRLESAIATFEKHLGPDSDEIPAPLFTLGHVHFLQDELTKAIAAYERAAKIRERANGPDHPGAIDARKHWAKALRARAEVRRDEGDVDGALADEQIADALEPTLPEDEPGEAP